MTNSSDGPETPAVAASDLQRRAIQGSFWTATHALLAVPVAFAANAVVARILGPADYGRLAFLTIALTVAVHVTNLGVSDAVVQWGAAAHAKGDRASVHHLLSKSLGYHLVVQLPLVLAFVIWLGHSSGLIVTGALIVGVSMPAVLGSAALKITIESRSADAAKLAIATNLALQSFIAVTAVVARTPTAVWAARSIGAAILLPATWLLLDRPGRRVARSVALPRDLPKGFWRYAFYSAAAGLVGLLVFSRSELILLSWLDHAVEAGAFALAFGLGQQLTAPVDALLGPLIPAVAGIVSAHPSRARAALLRATRWASLISGLLTAAVLPPLYFLVPGLYGSDFRLAARLLLPMAAVSCLQSILAPVTAFTRARGRTPLIFRVTAAALAIDVAVALALIPIFGVWGAVVANAVSQVVVLFSLVRAELRLQEIPLRSFARACSSWGIAAVSGTAAVCVISLASLPAAVAATCSGFAGGVVAVLGVRFARAGLTSDDAEVTVAALPPLLHRPVQALLRVVTPRKSLQR